MLHPEASIYCCLSCLVRLDSSLCSFAATNKAGVIAGAVIGAILLLLLLLLLIWLLICCCHKRRYVKEVANEIRYGTRAGETMSKHPPRSGLKRV